VHKYPSISSKREDAREASKSKSPAHANNATALLKIKIKKVSKESSSARTLPHRTPDKKLRIIAL
jgi:hypothetical protein